MRNLVFVSSNLTNGYYKSIGGSWTSFGNFVGPKGVYIFNKWIYIIDKLTNSSINNIVKVYNSSFNYLGNFNLGYNQSIIDFINYKESYIGLVTNNSIFLWDSNYNNSFISKVDFSGFYLGHLIQNENIFIFILENNNLKIYFMKEII